jgi:hypothetical protein
MAPMALVAADRWKVDSVDNSAMGQHQQHGRVHPAGYPTAYAQTRNRFALPQMVSQQVQRGQVHSVAPSVQQQPSRQDSTQMQEYTQNDLNLSEEALLGQLQAPAQQPQVLRQNLSSSVPTTSPTSTTTARTCCNISSPGCPTVPAEGFAGLKAYSLLRTSYSIESHP